MIRRFAAFRFRWSSFFLNCLAIVRDTGLFVLQVAGIPVSQAKLYFASISFAWVLVLSITVNRAWHPASGPQTHYSVWPGVLTHYSTGILEASVVSPARSEELQWVCLFRNQLRISGHLPAAPSMYRMTSVTRYAVLDSYASTYSYKNKTSSVKKKNEKRRHKVKL